MPRRSGGRKSRVAIRTAPLAEELKPVRPGESGGQYRPLTDDDTKAIVENCFRILEEVGFSQATPHCIETCTAYGAELGKDGRLRMSRDVVQNALDATPNELTLCAQDPAQDLTLSGSKVFFSTAGAAVMVVDPVTGEYRDSTAQDLYDMARITDTCEHIHMFQRTCVPRDILDNCAMDINTTYNAIMGTSKHVGASWTEAYHLQETLKLLHVAAGSEAAGQAGATAPPCLAGTISQAWAECLGGLVYVNAIKPGAPAIVGTWPFVSDLRTGAMSGGSPEQGILSAACAQIGQYLSLPMGTGCGMSDSKIPDFQAGSEHGYNAAVAALSGANVIYEAAGMYASLLGTCPESLLLDNDILGACLRMVKGVTVNTETLAFDALKEVCLNGPGHYLGTEQTLSVMQTEYIYPEFSNRLSPNDWKDAGRPDLLTAVITRKKEILSSHVPRHISDEVDAKIRAQFPIFLSREAMGRG